MLIFALLPFPRLELRNTNYHLASYVWIFAMITNIDLFDNEKNISTFLQHRCGITSTPHYEACFIRANFIGYHFEEQNWISELNVFNTKREDLCNLFVVISAPCIRPGNHHSSIHLAVDRYTTWCSRHLLLLTTTLLGCLFYPNSESRNSDQQVRGGGDNNYWFSGLQSEL